MIRGNLFKFVDMSILEPTIQDIEKNLHELPPDLLRQVNDYVSFLKERYLDQNTDIPQWQIDEVMRRKKEMEENPENSLSEEEMKAFLNDIENGN